MIDRIERQLATLRPRQRALLLWLAAGAALQASLPSLHHAWTPAGPAALWLWLLPAAAFGLDLLLFPPAGGRDVQAAAVPARRRRGAIRGERGLSRRERPRSPARLPARPARRAG